MSLKLGRTPATFDRRQMETAVLLAHHLDPLGLPPPESNNYVGAVEKLIGTDWGMMGNDQYGDCVIASEGHMMMLRTANTGMMVEPSTQQILDLYTAETGFNPSDPNTDQGTNMNDDMAFMRQVGLLGHKAEATGSVLPQNMNHVKWCVQLFGACDLGVNVPQSMMDQFNRGEPFDDVGDRGILGGHAIPLVHYDPTGLYVVTWGRRWPMTQRFFDTYCEEAHALLFSDWIRAAGSAPNDLSLSQLAQDLTNVVN
jgi:hypothetical protein